ncbi:MAG: BTAD domain-containing putative transcriptional regulator [Microbacteriaceae bacterium]
MARRRVVMGSETRSGPVLVRVLGPVRIGTGGTAIGGRQGACLALLASHANELLPRVQLADALYGSERSARTDQDLHVVLSRLRRRLREVDEDILIEGVGSSCRLSVDRALVDACRFEDLLTEARAAMVAAPHHAAALLDDAIALWEGPVFAGTDLGASSAAVRLEELRLLALECRFEVALQLGRHREVAAELTAMCGRYPHHERLWVLAIRTLDRCGRKAEALALYQQARRRLRDDLGLDPGAMLIEAEREVLGVDRQATGPSRPASTGSAPAGTGEALIGRDAVLQSLAEAVDEHPIVTVTGPGGVGKTALVREHVRHGRPPAVTVCELSALDVGAPIEHAIAAASGIRLPPDRSFRDGLIELLRNHVSLLVLDNCEHVVTQVREVVGALQREPARTKVLATSRIPLGLPSEQQLPLGPLDETHAEALFRHRAARADPSSAHAFEREEVAALCAALDHLPLAIELAAARVRTLTPVEMVDRRAELRAALRRPAAPRAGGRDHSIEASLSWSWSLLSDEARRLLELLSVFGGWFDATTALEICRELGELTDGAAIGGLAELVDASMLMAERVGTATRYRLLFMVRDFAADRAAQHGRLAAAERAHAEVITRAVERIADALVRADELVALRELDERWPDVRLAVRRALQRGWVDIGARMVTRLSAECHARERFEVGQWAEQLLEVGEIESHHLFADVLGTASMGDWVRARFDVGWDHASRGLKVWRADRGALAGPLAVGWLINAGVRAAADAAITEELAEVLRAEERLTFWLHWFQASRALVRSYNGDRDGAALLLVEMERLRAAQPSRLADCIAGLCRVVFLLDDDPAAAAVLAAETMGWARTIRATWFLGPLANYRAAALIAAGDTDAALDEVAGAVARARAGGAAQSVANTARNLVVLADRLGATHEAAALAGWLGARPISIAGTPGMRGAAQAVIGRHREHGTGAVEIGATLDLDGAIQELGRLTERLRGVARADQDRVGGT